MRKIFDIALNDLRIIFRQKDIWINLVVIPLALAYVVGLAGSAGGGPGVTRLIVDVIDHDSTAFSAQFLADVRAANGNLVLCPMDNTEADVCQLESVTLDEALIQQRLMDQTSLALIEIPAGFEASLQGSEAAEIIYRSNEDATAPSYILQAVQAVTQRLGGALVASRVGTDVISALDDVDVDSGEITTAIYSRAAELWAQDLVTVNYVEGAEVQTRQIDTGFGQSVPGMASMYVMFAVLPAMAAFMLERKQGTMQRLITMPVSRAQVLAGKLLARFSVGMIQYAIVFLFGLILGVKYGSDPLALLLVMVAYTGCITALTLAVMTLLRTEAQAQGIALFLTLTLAPLGGGWWPLEIVPGWMQTIGHISPLAWAMDGYRSLMFFDGNLTTVLLPIGVLLSAAVVLFVFGVSRFRYE
jgi:ABC-2 type transport system permease protein